MADPLHFGDSRDSEVLRHYALGAEQSRLTQGSGRLEFVRTCEVITRFFPPPPAAVLDVGGGVGAYALWLARRGYAVSLIDASPLHVEQAREASRQQADYPLAGVTLGDARQLEQADGSCDALLLLGPLYHLTERADRVTAWREAGRVLRPGGIVLGAAISRFASTLDGLRCGVLDDPVFSPIAARDLIDGQHRNVTENPQYFTTAYFHHPDELAGEIREAGLRHELTLGVEGPGWLLQDFDAWWSVDSRRERLIAVARTLESEPTLLGVSAHLLAVARKLTA
jgi:ubiquinone/menaquinone biosynthesis C-methylase UbiE